MPHEIREVEMADLQTYCSLWNEVWPNNAQDLEQLVQDMTEIPEHLRTTRWIGLLDGTPSGFGEAYHPAGTYHVSRWELHVGIVPSARGNGLGNALYEHGWRFVDRPETASVTSQVREDDPVALRFVGSRGYVEVKRDFESLLDLSTVPDDALWPVPDGVRIVSLASVDGPEVRKNFYELFEEIRFDVPRTEPPEPLGFEFFQRHVLGDSAFSFEGTHLAFMGDDLVGFSGVFRGANEGWLDQWLTAVRREHRGRGIAGALKSEVLLWARSAGFLTIRTDNDTRNTGMLAINDRMGFRRLPALITVRKTIR